MKHSFKEYILYINLRLFSKILTFLPLGVVLCLGRTIGTVAYYCGRRQRGKAYKNLRIALADQKTAGELKKILRKNFQNFGMNLTEFLRISKIDKKYIERNIEMEGEENLKNALKQKRGLIALSIHIGNWEAFFATSGVLGHPLSIVVEEQVKAPLLNRFLIQLRQSKGVGVLKTRSQMREIIQTLKENRILGLVADHGIKEGLPAEFFGHQTLTPSGAVKLALKYKTPILPVFIRRISGERHKITYLKPLDLTSSGDPEKDILSNLASLNRIFEGIIRQYPEQYFWVYKRFKYNRDRQVLILSDAKAGHLRQSQAALKLIEALAKKRNLEIKVKQVKVDFKNKFYRNLQPFCVGLAKRSSCQGCLWCLKKFLKPQTYLKLQSTFADIVISCGSSLAGINFIVSSENQAKSVVIMRPGILSTKRFDLAIIPRHDNPAKRKNTVITDGSLNSIDQAYLERSKAQTQNLIRLANNQQPVLGLCIGGNTKSFHLGEALIKEAISQIKNFAEQHDAQLLITTSRRTSPEIEKAVKDEFSGYPRCRLLVIANEKNIPDAVAAILASSDIVVISPESVSMISEAASAKRYVFVFEQEKGLGKRHIKFLRYLDRNGYVYLKKVRCLTDALGDVFTNRPPLRALEDRFKVTQALERIL